MQHTPNSHQKFTYLYRLNGISHLGNELFWYFIKNKKIKQTKFNCFKDISLPDIRSAIKLRGCLPYGFDISEQIKHDHLSKWNRMKKCLLHRILQQLYSQQSLVEIRSWAHFKIKTFRIYFNSQFQPKIKWNRRALKIRNSTEFNTSLPVPRSLPDLGLLLVSPIEASLWVNPSRYRSLLLFLDEVVTPINQDSRLLRIRYQSNPVHISIFL